MAIPQSFIQELLARVDIVEVVGRHVTLKRGGANWMGLCPFHTEKSPSFSVSPSKQFFHCFGCGKNGNAIGFLMEHTGASFVEAVEDLAQQLGLKVPQEEQSVQQRGQIAQQQQQQKSLTQVLDQACTAYQKQLKASPKAVAYCKGRGLSGEIARQFRLGYASPGWHGLASVFAQYDDPLLVESGLLIEQPGTPGEPAKRYDRFRDRIMFPIRNVKGQCIGFGARVLGDEKPKYLNSPETPVFSKGHELYGLYEARTAIRTQGYVLVTEGYMDVVALAQLGFGNAVATLGTACTADHVKKLFRWTDCVVFSFDGDAAGRRAARKALEAALPWASDTRSIKFLFLPTEHDPDSYIRAHGHEAFAHYVNNAVPLSRFLLEAARDGCDLQTAEGRAHMLSNAKPLWELLPSGALKQQLMGEIARAGELGQRELHAVWFGTDRSPRLKPAQRNQNESGYRNGSKAYSQNSSEFSGQPTGVPDASRRADHAVRLVLDQLSLLQGLTPEDLALLGQQAPPHGPLFAWAEQQLNEHGPQPWGVLREGLSGHPHAAYARRLMADLGLQDPIPAPEAAQELRQLLNRMLVEQLKREETLAIEAARTDPQALQRYRQIQARRLALEASVPRAGGPTPPPS
ncbi:MAG: hypothetical protein Fur007_05530 [Rhodoferax sp.]